MTNSPTNSLPFYQEAKRYYRNLDISTDCPINQQFGLKQLIAQLPDDVRLERFGVRDKGTNPNVFQPVLRLTFSSREWKDTADQPLRATIEQTVVLK